MVETWLLPTAMLGDPTYERKCGATMDAQSVTLNVCALQSLAIGSYAVVLASSQKCEQSVDSLATLNRQIQIQ
jgi:hypothetical protein